jgi:hypothetical protein
MAGESDEPDTATSRLEAALERIAAAAERRVSESLAAPVVVPEVVAPAFGTPEHGMTAAPDIAELAARLDGLIERLRGALAVRPG